MDLEHFRARARRKKQPLSAFLDKFDELVPETMADVAAKVDATVWKDVDCTTCANCCKTMTPNFTKQDIDRISTHLRLSPANFTKKYLKKDDAKEWVIAEQPCAFLVDNKCSIYEVRPSDCAEFPHHDKKPFDAYNSMFKSNIMHCPATLMFVERLKKVVERDFEWE